MELAIPDFVSDYEYKAGNLTRLWGILLAFTVIYAVINIISLQFIDKDKR